jgi:hypothetical protein
VNFPQHSPSGQQFLNGGGWWEPLSIKTAIVVGGVVDAFDAGTTEQDEAARELCQFVPAQDLL